MMTMQRTFLVYAGLLILGGCAESASHTIQPTPQAQAMRQMLADIDEIRAFVYGGGSQRETEAAAADLQSWSKRIGELFPPGQASTQYVDMSPERVRRAPAAMAKAADTLSSVVQTGERTAIGEQLAETERTGCGVCHLSGGH
jgi:hypothetical protein